MQKLFMAEGKNSATVLQRNGFASCIPVAAALSNLCANYDKTPIIKEDYIIIIGVQSVPSVEQQSVCCRSHCPILFPD